MNIHPLGIYNVCERLDVASIQNTVTIKEKNHKA